MVRIYADVREKQSTVPERLTLLGVTVVLEQLTVGDYVLAEGVAVERKSVRDLASSVFDGRFFDQMKRLNQSQTKSYLLIEGDRVSLERMFRNWTAIDLAVASATIDYDIRVLYSKDQEETAQILKKLAEKLQSNDSSPINIHDKPKFSTLREKQLYVVQSLPNMGPKLSQKVLERFPTLADFFNAPLSKLEDVLGRARAEEVFRVIHSSTQAKETSTTTLMNYMEEPKKLGDNVNNDENSG